MTATRRDHRPPTPNTAFRKDVAGMQKPSSRPTIPGPPSRRTLIAAAVCGAPFTVGAAGAAAAPARPGPELAPPAEVQPGAAGYEHPGLDRKSTRLNSSHVAISYAVSCSE